MSHQEDILVVPTENLEQAVSCIQEKQSGFFDQTSFLDGIERCIRTHGFFKKRSEVETDESLKQIIPYVTLVRNNDMFVTRRKNKASEQRLKDKMSFGLGGHVRSEDIRNLANFTLGDTSWLQRELDEELEGLTTYDARVLGIIYDHKTEVGRVHCGVVYQLHVPVQNNITIQKEHASGQFMPYEKLPVYHDSMEAWSQFLIPFYVQKKSAL